MAKHVLNKQLLGTWPALGVEDQRHLLYSSAPGQSVDWFMKNHQKGITLSGNFMTGVSAEQLAQDLVMQKLTLQ